MTAEEARPISFDAPLGRRIIEFHVWAVRQGLLGAAAAELFDGFCRRLLLAGVPLWRGYAAMRTLHPQWGGYGYAWWRDLNVVQPEQFERGNEYEQDVLESPFTYLIRQAGASKGGRDPWRHLRRRLAGPEAQLDFPILEKFASAGATDYFAEIVRFGADGDPSHGIGVGYSFATDRPAGFDEDDLVLLRAALPVVSLAMMAHAGHTIASSLLAAYLGGDAGRRVHSGAIERGSVESVRAVLWYADIRQRGGEVLKFMGDGMLAIFRFSDGARDETCRRALDAASEAMHALRGMNGERQEAGKPVAEVDLALHIGEVLYGNVGAVDRLDFTVIGPAVNEVARIETLCEPLGRKVLVSAELARTVADSRRLEPLGYHKLRGVHEPREIYGLNL